MTFREWFDQSQHGKGVMAFCRKHNIVHAQLKKALDGKPLGPVVAKTISRASGGAISAAALVFPHHKAWERPRKRSAA